MYVSTGFTPIARTPMSTCPGPGAGSGTSSSFSTSGPPGWETRIAFMLAILARRVFDRRPHLGQNRRMPSRLKRRLLALASCVALACAKATFAQQSYELGLDSKPQEGVPQGNLTKHRWTSSKVFPGTQRDYWVYVPAQYDGSSPACVMVFQDGEGFVKPDGGYRAAIVLDNLIHKKEMPVAIGVFIQPGVIPAVSEGRHPRYNRSFEYDTPSDAYARFLLEEILPEVAKGYKLTDDPAGRGICGSSSGGICAFTAAWERPDAFSRVISFIGSFTDLK